MKYYLASKIMTSKTGITTWQAKTSKTGNTTWQAK